MNDLIRTCRRSVLGACLLAVACSATVLVPPASAQTGAWWRLDSGSAPTTLRPGSDARVWITAIDQGFEAVESSTGNPVVITDTLPAGLEAVPAQALAYRTSTGGPRSPLGAVACEISGQTVKCTITSKPIFASEGIEVVIPVKVSANAGETLSNTVTVAGGLGEKSKEAPVEAKPQTRELPVAEAETKFGIERYELIPENEKGGEATEAGTHPFQLTTVLDFNDIRTLDTVDNEYAESTPSQTRDLHFLLPPGLVGDVNIVERCSEVEFNTIYPGAIDGCPASTAIGVANIKLYEPDHYKTIVETVPVFNLVPAPGEPARFGIEFDKVTVPLTTSVKTGSNYAVEVSAENISTSAAAIDTEVTFWGVPGDPRHNESRGWECLGGGFHDSARTPPLKCAGPSVSATAAFLTLPALCAKLSTSVTAKSWPFGSTYSEEPSEEKTYEFPSTLTECGPLSEAFAPSIEVESESKSTSTPSGLTVAVNVPQGGTVTAGQRSEADVAETILTLPIGVEASPGAANGLKACGVSEIGLLPGLPEAAQLENNKFTPNPASCDPGSKIGSATIETPLLPHNLEGGVYLASQDTNLAEEKLVLYIVAQDPISGVLVKLAGEVHVDPTTGQLTSVFKNTPPVPFSKLTVSLFGGPRASQSTPAFCGPQQSSASFVPSSGGAAKPSSASFPITSGVGGGPCPGATRPLAPAFTAGSLNKQAGAFTNFTLSVGHSDSDQPLSGISTTLPPGAAALLSTITPCAEPSAGAPWSCGPESEMGQATTSSGLGGEPFTLGGRVYLTAGYDGAPFGLLVSTEAKAGPFNLGMVYVRSRINVNPETAQVTITSDPGPHGDTFPTRIKGIPVALKQLSVEVNRPHFQFNGTNCSPLAVSGTLFGSEGGAASVSSPFQVTGCASLPFAPKLTATTNGKGSKTEGTSFNVKLESAGLGQADIHKVDLTIPEALPARLQTLKKACTEAQFAISPAGSACSKESIIGHATVHTPVLRAALTGPAFLVSHGNASFPDVEFVLSGEGITLILDGKTDIKKGVTYSRFESAPDAPFTSFETELPAGPKSILGSYASVAEPENLCKANLAMPTEITAQDGAVLRQVTTIKPVGCSGVLHFKAETRAQKLAKALKACRKKYHGSKKKKKLAVCERKARAKYGAKKHHSAKKKSKKK